MYGYEWKILENNASEDIFLITDKSTATFCWRQNASPVLRDGGQSKICEIVNNVTIQAGSNTWEGRSVTPVMEKDGLSNDFCDFLKGECEELSVVILYIMIGYINIILCIFFCI